MSTCSVATGLLAVVAVIHFILTVVLTALVILVRCYCRQRQHAKVCPSCNPDVSKEEARSKETNTSSPDSEDRTSTSTSLSRTPIIVETSRRPGRISPPPFHQEPAIKVDLGQLDSEMYDNEGATTENWEEESSDAMKNKVVEKLRRESTSSVKKTGSPFRRISSPLTRSGRFSIASITRSRKSMDLDDESLCLMSSGTQAASPTEEHYQLSASAPVDSPGHHILPDSSSVELTDSGPTIIILQTSPDHSTDRMESEC